MECGEEMSVWEMCINCINCEKWCDVESRFKMLMLLCNVQQDAILECGMCNETWNWVVSDVR